LTPNGEAVHIIIARRPKADAAIQESRAPFVSPGIRIRATDYGADYGDSLLSP
jgi:hypothetical protein